MWSATVVWSVVSVAAVQDHSERQTLQNMVQDRNQFITTMKSEIYRKEYRNDTQRVDMQTQLIHKDKLISSLEVSNSSVW